jgi:arylsulfatase A-like enzyme
MKTPNILVIMSDDQGPWAMHCAGTAELHTPNLDRIASEGIRFENFFCASPVCSPARASFLTGRMPSQHGVHDWIKHGNMEDSSGKTWHGPEESIEYLEGLTGFTDILAQNGYTCGLSGKWHLGASDVPQKSHDFWCSHALGGDSYTDYWVFDNNTKMTHKTQYVTDFFTDRAIDFLSEQKFAKQPFCLSVHYTAPHSPWRQEEQPPDIWNMYADSEFSLPIEKVNPWKGWNPSSDQRRETIQGYYTTITAMDRAIGRILDHLDNTGLAEDTLVIFTSDNGYSLGHHGIMGKGNGTYPLNMFEESVKVPFIVRLPGVTQGGEVNLELLSHYDVMPTLLDYLNLDTSSNEILPGKSFAPLLKGSDLDGSRESVVICDEYGPNRMLRTREWKYIQRYPNGPDELYDLVNDPQERINLTDDVEFKNRQQSMSKELEEWFQRYVIDQLDGSKLTMCRGGGQKGALRNNSHTDELFDSN